MRCIQQESPSALHTHTLRRMLCRWILQRLRGFFRLSCWAVSSRAIFNCWLALLWASHPRRYHFHRCCCIRYQTPNTRIFLSYTLQPTLIPTHAIHLSLIVPLAEAPIDCYILPLPALPGHFSVGSTPTVVKFVSPFVPAQYILCATGQIILLTPVLSHP